jgi:hypothetical protein
MSDLWYTTAPPVELVAFRNEEMFGLPTNVERRPWCSRGDIRDRLVLTPTRDRLDLDGWIELVPERIRETAAMIAIGVFHSTVAGKHSTPAILDEYASALCAALWRHYNQRPMNE